jgi:hypothetical protein
MGRGEALSFDMGRGEALSFVRGASGDRTEQPAGLATLIS